MGLLDRMLGRVECVKCGAVVPSDAAKASPVEVYSLELLDDNGARRAWQRQIEADAQARRADVGLLCSSCYRAVYEAMPTVRQCREVANLTAGGWNCEVHFHFDGDGHPIVDKD
jgi:hypothetical protein